MKEMRNLSLIYHVDAFTSEPFKGNPAAVCIMSEPAQEYWMQKVAQEMNLSIYQKPLSFTGRQMVLI